jgi:hypothetical protein
MASVAILATPVRVHFHLYPAGALHAGIVGDQRMGGIGRLADGQQKAGKAKNFLCQLQSPCSWCYECGANRARASPPPHG